MELSNYIRRFDEPVEGIELPRQFTFPFYYEPHPLVKLAANQLQKDLSSRDLDHNFGLDGLKEGIVIGKMFGVLVIEDQYGDLGFLASFSGKLAESNHHEGFVPPVYDMLDQDGYFKQEEATIVSITTRIEEIEHSDAFTQAKTLLKHQEEQAERDILRLKNEIKEAKANRKLKRKEAEGTLEKEAFETFCDQLSKESVKEQFTLKDAKKYWGYKLKEAEENLEKFTLQLQELKEERSRRSAQLQHRLFSEYTFLNARRELKSLLSIFHEKDQSLPTAGAGECSAPKLLHFAYQHKLKPFAMGEFWWGASPKSEVRNHQQFYPACRGKCEPILSHMLQGLEVEENPMLKSPDNVLDIEVVYEDDHLLVINKPAEFLSVPGKNVYDSVLTRMEARYPRATGPLLVHRLDMSTSGLLLVAKNKEAHKKLQFQFLKRLVSKRYEALLDGLLSADSGEIDLPLRVDLENRPQQLVCYEHGKPAVTRWEKVSEKSGKTLVNFYPITGRTHQLRVHAAHASGLNTPIFGDDIYGTRADRLHLHAAYLKFKHPVSEKEMEIHFPSGF